MIILERNQQNATKGNRNYLAKDFAWVQPKRTAFKQSIIGEEA